VEVLSSCTEGLLIESWGESVGDGVSMSQTMLQSKAFQGAGYFIVRAICHYVSSVTQLRASASDT